MSAQLYCKAQRLDSTFLAVTLLLLLPAMCSAQVAGGTISGTVKDSSGSVIGNVQITITNVATGVTRDVTTNDEGFYSAPNLLPGAYEAKYNAPGFKPELRSGIDLTVGASVVLDQALRVGSTTETIVVQSEVPAVQLSSSDISAVVNATTVRELPLNGRSWTDLAQLQPGVNAIQTQPTFAAGTDRGNRGFGQQLTISGARPQQNNYRLDGVSLNDYANGAPGSVLGGNLGVDAIQEFSVLTSNYSAEYGKTSGGVVNAITRSGTNQIHGSVYEFLRNSRLDSRNYFDDRTKPIPPFKRNQFGGSRRRTDCEGPHILLRRLRRYSAVPRNLIAYDSSVAECTQWIAVFESSGGGSQQSLFALPTSRRTEYRCEWGRLECKGVPYVLPLTQRPNSWEWRHRSLHIYRTADRQRELLHDAH